MADPFRYVVREPVEDEEPLLLPLRLGDGSYVECRILPGSVLLFDGPPGEPAGGGHAERS